MKLGEGRLDSEESIHLALYCLLPRTPDCNGAIVLFCKEKEILVVESREMSLKGILLRYFHLIAKLLSRWLTTLLNECRI